MICDKKFYLKNTVQIARELLGKNIIRNINGKKLKAKIVETEAYLGKKDKASHSYENNKSENNRFLYEEGGIVYIYIIYGIYYCLNIVTGEKNVPQSVFIRAAEPLKGLELMKKLRKKKVKKIKELTNGPAKLCQSLNLDKSFNGKKVYNPNSSLYISSSKYTNNNYKIKKAKRINVDYAKEDSDKKWRFYIANSKFCSH